MFAFFFSSPSFQGATDTSRGIGGEVFYLRSDMRKDPAFLFYASDFMTGTMFLTDDEVGRYVRLLCVQHQHGGLIDKAIFNSAVGSSVALRSKFIETEDGFFNKRLMEEMEKRGVKSANMSVNAHKRWDMVKQKQCNCIAIEMQPKDTNKDRDTNNIVKKEELFNIIWKNYPKAVGRKEALRHFLASVTDDEKWVKIQIALDNYKKSKTVKDGFIQNGSTWFNNWQDWIESPEKEEKCHQPRVY